MLAAGCAHGVVAKEYDACAELPAETAAAQLGVTLHPPAPSAFDPKAAASFSAAPPWEWGQPRVYPRDYGFDYGTLGAADGVRADTPLWCEIEFHRRARKGLFSADPLTRVDLSVVYAVGDDIPVLRQRAAKRTEWVRILDSTHRFESTDTLRFAITDIDVLERWGFPATDDIASFSLEHGQSLSASTGVQWRGTTTLRCRHLDPAQAEAAYDDTLALFDRELQAFRPRYDFEGYGVGLQDSGMGHLRVLLRRAASLGHGWDDPELLARSERLLDRQQCFEQAVVEPLRRKTRRISRDRPLRGLRLGHASALQCADPEQAPGDRWPSGRCEFDLSVRVPADGAPTRAGVIAGAVVVLAGGREVNAWPIDPPEVQPGTEAVVRMRLEPSVTEAVPLTTPVMLRWRRDRLFGDTLVRSWPIQPR